MEANLELLIKNNESRKNLHEKEIAQEKQINDVIAA
jgi:hypothetical protein